MTADKDNKRREKAVESMHRFQLLGPPRRVSHRNRDGDLVNPPAPQPLPETSEHEKWAELEKGACKHEVFVADVVVGRHEEDGTFSADIKITCDQCNLPFSFIGVPFGVERTRPTSSVDGSELRAPIQPGLNTEAQVVHAMRKHGGLNYEV